MLALQAQGAYLTSDIHDQMDPAVAVMYRPFRRYWIDRTRPDTVGSMPTKIRRCNFWDPTIAPVGFQFTSSTQAVSKSISKKLRTCGYSNTCPNTCSHVLRSRRAGPGWTLRYIFLAENVAGEPPSPKLPKDAGPTRISRTLEDTLETSLNN
ncbi:hypothetical protein PGTUg99_034112 [Puccinia graminis f. sp. tritici]|uniref:Uncharacterized protein n=1 Tax=Puccinia graminis f. sp. tritici TaxID=56615 RepID=A0A5B0SKF1_PUCGR|nr:hypothetical protein PGTUg99_034112 [Puccinia graminis f. sp. tritici]